MRPIPVHQEEAALVSLPWPALDWTSVKALRAILAPIWPKTAAIILDLAAIQTYEQKYRENIVVMANEEQAGVCHHIYWLTAAEMGYVGLGPTCS